MAKGLETIGPLYIDVELSSVLGSELPPPTTYIARRLKCEDPRVVRAYNRAFKRFLINKGLDFDAHKLADRIQRPLSSHNQVEYERIDGLRIQGIVYAEKKCRKLKMGGIPWTPELARLRSSIEVWQLVRRRIRHCKVGAKTILRKKRKAKMEGIDTNVDYDTATENMGKLFTQYKEYITDSTNHRQHFQRELAVSRAKEGNARYLLRF